MAAVVSFKKNKLFLLVKLKNKTKNNYVTDNRKKTSKIVHKTLDLFPA